MKLKLGKTTYSKLPQLLIVWLVLLIVGKIILTSREEMVAVWSPHDDLWQVWSAQRWYWGGGAYGTDHLYRLPIYPLFIKLVSITGIPLRIAVELIYCLSCSLLSISLFRIGIPAILAATLAFVGIFQPYSFQLFNHFSPEVFLGSLLMLALAYSIQWWVTRKRKREAIRSALLSALFWALAWNTREESIILLPILITLGICVLIVDHKEQWLLKWRRVFIGVILPILLCISFRVTICSINYFRWGLFSTSILTAPGYLAAYRSLQAIDVSPKIPYIPITREARKAAYAVSPTFALLEPQLEGALGQMWARVSKQWTDCKGIKEAESLDISAGWFFWALYDAIAQGGYAQTPAQGDLFLKQIAKEINTAFKQHKLSKRWVPLTMVDPNTLDWISRYWTSLQRVYKLFISFSITDHNINDEPMLEENVKKEFDFIANRRNSKLTKSDAIISGWASVQGQTIKEIQVVSPDDEIIIYLHPKEVQKNTGTCSRRFTIHIPEATKNSCLENKLIVLTDEGDFASYSIKEMVLRNPTSHLSLKGSTIYLCFDRILSPFTEEYWSWNAQAIWEKFFYSICPYLQWIALIGIMIAFLRRKNISLNIFISLSLVAFLSRVLLFALFDATTCSGDQPRYLFAVMPEFSMLLILGSWNILQESKEFFTARK